MLPEILTAIPGPKSLALAEKIARYEARQVTMLSADFPVFWERAEGSNVWDADGNRFLDFTSAFAVCGLGHSAPALRDALVAQATSLLHTMGDVHPGTVKAELCEVLSRITFERWGAGVGKSLLCNSGSEAVEAALKTAFMHNRKPGVLAFTGAYHGLGYGALEAGGLSYFRDPFKPQLGRFAVHAPFPKAHPSENGAAFSDFSTPTLEETRMAIGKLLRENEIGSIIVEPIQGRGGEVVPSRGFLPMLRAICDEHGILLILDEIYTGFNRTGRLFACEHSEVVPDLICLGKGLTGGFPLAACVGKAAVMDAWPLSQGEALHTSTTLGNPLGCAMALASIKEHLKAETAAQAETSGRMLREALLSLKSPHIGEIRGAGTMLGMELLRADGSSFGALSGAMMLQGLKDGLIILGGGPEGNILSFSPSFYLTPEEITFLRDKLQEYLISLPGSIS